MSENSSTTHGQSSPPSASTNGHRPAPPHALYGVVPSSQGSWEIARVDLLRGYRWVKQQDFWLAFTVLMGVIGAFLLWVTFDAARDVGTTLAVRGSTPAWLVTATGVIWLFMTILLAGDGVGSNGDLDNDGQYLTIRPAADIVGGKMLAAASKFSVYTFGLGLAAGAGLVAGTGSALPLVRILAAAIVIPVTAVAIGYPIGFAVKGIIRRSRNLGRITTIIGVVLGFSYVILSVTGELLTVVERLEPILQAPPVAWFGHLALVTTPNAGIDVTGAFILLGLTPVVAAAGTMLSVPASRYAWLADTARTGNEETDLPTAPDHHIDAVLNVICRAPATRGIASTTLLRAVRSPLQFVFVAPPLLAAISFVEGAVTSGSVPWYAPWFIVWYGAWAAGAVIPLNPLGNQGATLPTLLTTPARGQHVVHGHVAAAALLGTPLTAGLAIGAGYLAGVSEAVLIVLGLVSVATVLGIGSPFDASKPIKYSKTDQNEFHTNNTTVP